METAISHIHIADWRFLFSAGDVLYDAIDPYELIKRDICASIDEDLLNKLKEDIMDKNDTTPTQPRTESFLDKARSFVTDYYNLHREQTDNFLLDREDVYVVWGCKTLQNWKALVSTNVSDGMYYEVTYNGDKGETYIDAYKKFNNVCIKDAQ